MKLLGKKGLARRKMREWKRTGKPMICEGCGCDDEEVLTIDHIIPITILVDFGIETEEMFEDKYIQLYCHNCNKKKGQHIDIKHPKTKELLQDLLNN